jgi:hypothetical protein
MSWASHEILPFTSVGLYSRKIAYKNAQKASAASLAIQSLGKQTLVHHEHFSIPPCNPLLSKLVSVFNF